jgi:3-hydroxyisobutyrate dehydrogenase-like beta-hydroxyacid dehydrogenase
MNIYGSGIFGRRRHGPADGAQLLDARHCRTVYDISEAAMRPLLERQVRRAASPQDLADRCEIVSSFRCRHRPSFREVAFGAESLTKGRAIP